MSSIDERIVEMKFNNADFQKGVQSTLDSLDKLNKGLKLEGATKGLETLSSTAKGLQLGHIGDALDSIKSKFTAMGVVGISVMASLASKAVDAGLKVIKSFTLDPITAGFKNYETQINAVQTILANTGLKGAAGMAQVNKVLQELNTYANQTVYNFSDMTKNIGTFTAAGVGLQTASDAIKGIANLAALSGSNADQASMAMYQLSQAIAANKVGLQDWNSVVNAGLGGQVFQKALFNTGVALKTIKDVPMGTTFEQWTKAGNSFRGSLQSGWVTGKVLTQTLSQFTGDLTDAQLKAQGYTADEIKQIQELAKVAVGAATNIKTFTQLKDALKEEVATAYAAIFKTLFGDITTATTLFSKLHVVLENGLTGPIYAINKVLQGWSAFGGRTMFIDSIKKAFQDLEKVIAPIKDAFKEIFPDGNTVAVLLKLTFAFHNLVSTFKIGDQTLTNLKKTFAGVFAIFDIGWQIVKQVARVFVDLLSSTGKGSGGILQFTANLGDMLVAFDKALKKGEGLKTFFNGIERVLKPVVEFISNLVGELGDLSKYIQPALGKFFDFVQNIGAILGPIADSVKTFFLNLFSNVDFTKVVGVLNAGLLAAVALLIKRIADKFKGGGANPLENIVKRLMEPFEELTNTLKTMQQTLKATTLLEIAAAVGILTLGVIGLSKIDAAGLTKALTALSVMFIQLFAALAVFDKIGGSVKLIGVSAGLILFAVAIDTLTIAVKNLSGLSWKELAKGLTGVAGLIAGLTLAVRGMALEKDNMVSTGIALLALAFAIDILVKSVKDFSNMNWAEIGKGLTGVAGLLTSLTLFTKFAETDKAGITSGAGIVLLASGIKILASAAEDFGKLSWGEIAKGMASISGILLAVALFSKGAGSPATLLASGASLVAIGVAMQFLAKAIAAFGHMSWGEIGKGLVTMAGALTLIAAAVNAMPPETVLSAAALVGVSIALVGIAKAMETMGGMAWEDIAKGLVTLAGALVIIGLATTAMVAALPGAAAILVVSAALVPLTEVLKTMGDMSWEAIGKSLVELAGAFVVIGVAGLALTPIVPTLLGLGVAIAAIGVGVALAGAGVALFGVGLTALATSGAAAAGSLALIFTTILNLLPQLEIGLGKTLAALGQAIVLAAPSIYQAGVVLMTGLLNSIVQLTPKIAATFVVLVGTLLTTLEKNAPKFLQQMLNIMVGMLLVIAANQNRIVNAVADIIVNMLRAIGARVPDFVVAAGSIIVGFINGLSKHLGEVITAGTNLIVNLIKGITNASLQIINAAMDAIVTFVNGLASAIETHTGELQEAGKHLAFAIADGMTMGLASKVGDVASAAGNMAKGAYEGAKSFLGIKSPSKLFMQVGDYVAQGFALGISGGTTHVAAAWHTMGSMLDSLIKQSASNVDKYSKQLASLEAAHTKNNAAIYLTTLALHQAQTEYAKATKALDILNFSHAIENKQLTALAKQWDSYTPKINAATTALNNAKKVRDDFAAQTTQQFDVLPDISNDTNLTDYINTLTYQVNDMNKFTQVLTQLRKLGLNDALYKELLSKGPSSLNFAEQLLAGGSTAVKSLDTLSGQLDTAAGGLGKAAGTALYQAGVDAAQGIVDGLKKQQDAIAAQMVNISKAMIDAIKKTLGIKSPSKVFMEVAGYIGDGFVSGLKAIGPDIQSAAQEVGQTTVDALTQAISSASDIMDENLELNPKIAPVVDLTEVNKGVDQINAALSDKTLNVGATVTLTKDVSAGIDDNPGNGEPPTPPPAASVTYIQNNNSPKALSSAEIYRQTSNQLSRTKGALTTSAA